MSNNTETTIRFNFYSLSFEPYNHLVSKENTRSILKQIFQYLREVKNDGKGHLIDRHENRDESEPRELFVTTSRFLPKENRILCTLALLRKGRKPKLKPKDKFKLMAIDEMGDIAETTQFVIDLNTNSCIICAEYNYYGPRIWDLEYYLRNLANNNTLGLAKQTSVNVFFESTLEYTLLNLQNVLKIDVKANPKNLKLLDSDVRKHFFSGLSDMGDKLKPKFIRYEAYFQTPGKLSDDEINVQANNYLINLLNKFKTNPRNIKHFENFVVKYQNKEGEDKFFDLLKGKKEFTCNIDLKKNPTGLQVYELIKNEINSFVEAL